MTSWVTWVISLAFQGLHHGGKGTTPLGPGLPGCPWWNVLLSLRCNPLICLCSLLGSRHPSSGLLAPWRSELIISPCVPIHLGTCHWVWTCNIYRYALHGLTSHRDHSYVNHFYSSNLLNMCIKPPSLGQALKDIILIYKPSLEEALGHPIGLMLIGCGMFQGEVKSRPCEWMRW
jgi:hypothetical protein